MGPNLTIANVGVNNAGSYTVVVSNALEAVTSNPATSTGAHLDSRGIR